MAEADICERYGWTFSQLDEEDEDRTMAAFSLQNLRDKLANIKRWQESVGKTPISQSELKVYEMIMQAHKEVEAEYESTVDSIATFGNTSTEQSPTE